MFHVLLVDDEPEVVNALSRVLMRTYQISKCHSAEDAMQIMASTPVDLVLSDIRMPGMDGIELLTQIKEQYPATARVLLSGYSDIEVCQNAIDNNIAEVILAKPWDNFELKNILSLVLKYQKLHIENQELKKIISE